jgi:molecular chaperone GrpE
MKKKKLTKEKFNKKEKRKDSSLAGKIADLEKAVIVLTNKWKRALADYQNLEKRVNKEQKDLIKFTNAALIDKFLSVLDHLEKAEDHLKDKGLIIAVDQFRQVLAAENVSQIKALNKNFDPIKMDCVEVVKGKKDKVIEVIQKGYLINDKVLRPAKVKVGKG